MKKYILTLCSFFCFLVLHAQVFPTETILDNGSACQRIKFVFLSDGYQSSELPSFINQVNVYKNYIFTQTPFMEYRNFFNFYAVKVPSVDSGCNHAGTAVDENTSGGQPVSVVNTYFNSRFDTPYNNEEIHRYVVPLNRPAVFSVAASNIPNYNQIFVLCNSPYYGGSGGSDEAGISTGTAHSDSPEVAVHEIGHSFGNLADEYEIDGPGQGELANRTQTTNPNTIKWKNWLGTNGVGIYQIGTFPWYRPHQNCKMRQLDVPFCSVCKEAIINSIYQLVTPICSYAPMATNVTVTSATNFSAVLTQPIPNTLKSDWKLNGVSIANNVSTVNITPTQLSAGTNTLTLYVTDTTSLSRSYLPNSGYIFSQTWTINSSVLPLELLRFDATKKENDVLLNWKTTNEQNTSHFNIQRSTDGAHFSNIGKVMSNNKTTLNDYRYEDKNLPFGTLYYRLEQVDVDGKTTFSPIRSVEKSDKFYYNLSPNPTQDVLTINGNADYDLDMTIEIYNEIGSCVYKQDAAVNRGTFEQKIDMAHFAEGAYIVLMRLPNGFSMKKTIVKVK